LGWLFKHVDRFFYIGSPNRRLYESFGVTESKLYPAPYAVDNQRFAQQATALRSQRVDLRRKWRIADDSFCVLFCGKFIEKKRPMDLVAAARWLCDRGLLPNLHLLFVGSGVMGPELRRSCNVVFDAESPITSPAKQKTVRATFAGFMNQTEISRAYVAADCLVLPSDHGETWGLVVNEALASGLPCLISNACGCAEELAGEAGSFQCSNIPELASKMTRAAAEGVKLSVPPSISDSVSSICRAYHDLSAASCDARQLTA
jgi:glycosyltransferase involved in cell wall biosynthesis